MIINPEQYGTLIGVDSEVLGILSERAQPFVDDPNAVLRRVLGLDRTAGTDPVSIAIKEVVAAKLSSSRRNQGETKASPKSKAPRARKGSLTPEESFERPLLEVLDEAGGSAPSREVLTRVGQVMADVLNDEDRFEDDRGIARWQKRVPFVRLKLVQRGLMSNDAERGIWQITDDGRSFARATLTHK